MKIVEKYPPLQGSPASFIFVSPDDRSAFNELCEANKTTSERMFSIILQRYIREMNTPTVSIPVIGTLECKKRILAVGRGNVVTVCPHEHQVTEQKAGIYGPDDYRETVVCTDCGKELSDDEIVTDRGD